MLNIHVERYWAERLSPLLDRHSFIIENRVSYESLFLSGSIAYSKHTGMEQVCFHQPGKNLETWKTCLKRVGAKYSKNSIILKKYRIFMLKVKFDSNI